MRIAVVTTTFLPKIGGAEFAVHHLANQWCAQGHDVRVFNSITDRPTHPEARYSVSRYKSPRGGDRLGHHRFPFRWYGARQVARVLDRFRPEFVSAHFGYPVALWLSWITPTPRFVITCHGPTLNESPTGPRQVFGIDAVIAAALNTSRGVVALSTHAHKILERMGVDERRILDIPNGVDTTRFRKPVDFDLRHRFGLPRDAIVVLSVGREVWAKSYDIGIKAFAEASKEMQKVFYLILGRGVTRWQELAGEVAGPGRVILCDGLYDDELVGAYQQADIFLLPSVKETFSLALLEAMAAGLPVVVTDVSGSQDAIANGDNGWVVPPGQVDQMAVALRRLIDDGDLRRRFGEANRQRSELYRWERISRLYLEQGAG